MKKMSFGIAFFFIAVSCYVLFSAQSFPGKIDNVPGPGYFPTILSILLIVLSLLLLATSGNASNAPSRGPPIIFSKLAIIEVVIYYPYKRCFHSTERRSKAI